MVDHPLPESVDATTFAQHLAAHLERGGVIALQDTFGSSPLLLESISSTLAQAGLRAHRQVIPFESQGNQHGLVQIFRSAQ